MSNPKWCKGVFPSDQPEGVRTNIRLARKFGNRPDAIRCPMGNCLALHRPTLTETGWVYDWCDHDTVHNG